MPAGSRDAADFFSKTSSSGSSAAGRGRLVRQFLTESLVLAWLGGGVGLAMAAWFSARLFTLLANGRDVVPSVTPDYH